MNEHLYPQRRSQTMKSQTMRSNSLYEKPGCDVHGELKYLKFIQHFSWAVHNNAVRQPGVGFSAHFTHRETDALRFMHLRPWKAELQAKGYLWLAQALCIRYKN